MTKRPFLELKDNMDKIDFNVDAKFLPEYKRAFGAVLERMDKHFVKNNLYEAVDYEKIVDDLLSGKEKFGFSMMDVDFAKEKHWAGVHRRYRNGNREIGMNAEYMGKGTTTEGTLCHEWMHHLTLGPTALAYKENGENYEVVLPQRSGNIYIGGRKINTTRKSVDGLEAGTALDGGFICEALTELSKQQMYTKEESYHAYIPQTSMVGLLDKLSGSKFDMKQFLRGDLPNYVQALGKDEKGKNRFDEFNKHCENFQKKFEQNHSINELIDPDYIKAQDIVVQSFLDKVLKNPEKYTPEQFVDMASTILIDAPVKNGKYFADQYRNDIFKARNAVADAQKNLNRGQRTQLSKFMGSVINQKLESELGVSVPAAPNFRFKEQKNGGYSVVHGGMELSSSQFSAHYSTKRVFKTKNESLAVENPKFGVNRIISTNQSGKETSIDIKKEKSQNTYTITNNKTQESSKINLIAAKKRQEREEKTSKNLLRNFEHTSGVKNILDDKENAGVSRVKKLTTENGDEYLVAGSGQSDQAFYKITPEGYKRVNATKRNVQEDIAISKRYTVGIKEETSATAILPGKEKTDEFSKEFQLEDGSRFVSYFNEEGLESLGQKIGDKIVECNAPTIYNKHNESIAEMMNSDNFNLGGDEYEGGESVIDAPKDREKSQMETAVSNAEAMQEAKEEARRMHRAIEENASVDEEAKERENAQEMVNPEEKQKELQSRAVCAGMRRSEVSQYKAVGEKEFEDRVMQMEEENARRQEMIRVREMNEKMARESEG